MSAYHVVQAAVDDWDAFAAYAERSIYRVSALDR